MFWCGWRCRGGVDVWRGEVCWIDEEEKLFLRELESGWRVLVFFGEFCVGEEEVVLLLFEGDGLLLGSLWGLRETTESVPLVGCIYISSNE